MTAPRQDPGRDRADRVVLLRAWRAVLETANLVVEHLDGELREQVGLDIQTYDALLHTFEAGDDGIRMSDLATAVVLTKAGLTALVDRLEARGLVERAPDPSDRRVTRIRLTSEGTSTFKAAAKVHLIGIQEHVGNHLTMAEADTIVRTLGRVRDALDRGP